MNPLNLNHIKVEKANVIKLRYQKLRKITNFFRVFEFFLVLAVISRVSFKLPLAIFSVSSEYFHNISLILISPKFVFIVGNVIVVILFINSGHFTTHYSNMKTPKVGAYGKKSVKFDQHKNRQGRTEENTIMATIFSTPEHQVIRIYHRSKSEKNIRSESVERPESCSLQRSKTEINRSKCSSKCYKDAKEGHYPVDRMSNDEFNKTVEDFIAKQQRLLREEEDFTSL